MQRRKEPTNNTIRSIRQASMKKVIYMNQISIEYLLLLTEFGFTVHLRGWGEVDANAALGLSL